MREMDVWRNATEAEFDNAMEGMEKLVMNRLYELYISPYPLFFSSPQISPYPLAHSPPKSLALFPRAQ